MIASSTVKNVPKKEPSGAEKKRAKMRREFIANIVMATPDDAETEAQKEERKLSTIPTENHIQLALNIYIISLFIRADCHLKKWF